MNDPDHQSAQEHATPGAASVIEAILLVTSRLVSVSSILSATALPKPEAQDAIEELKERYAPGTSGIVLREVAGGFQLATNPICADVLERFRKEARPAPLSGAAYEVLACVLYLGPLTRAAINEVRGVNSDAVVRNLLDRNLLAEAGRERSRPGAPVLLDLTEDFLLATGAKSRDDFPSLSTLIDPEEIERIRARVRGQGQKISGGGEE